MFRCCFILIALVSPALAGEISSDELKHEFVGHTFALRQPLRGTEIAFLPDGTPVPPTFKGTFGRDALIHVFEVKLEGPNLIIRGRRSVLIAPRFGAPFQLIQTEEKTKVTVALPTLTRSDLDRLLATVFLGRAEFQITVRNYQSGLQWPGVLQPDRPVYTGCKLQALSSPGPRAWIKGRILARMIVNELGEPEAIALEKPLSSKSDQAELLAALWNWRFAPVRRNGKPVACSSALGLNFHR